jgi:multidrug efflux pump subunit AcrB
MNGFNLSRWALEHRSFVWYLMLLFVVSGVWSYLRLGREEDPPFTVKTMIVATAWPGATMEETILQVTDRIEKKLQETPSLDYLKSYTQSGQSTILVVLKESTPPAIVPDVWDKVRKKVDDIRTTLPQGIQGPFFNDGFGDTVGTIYAFTADGFTARELRDYVEQVRSELLAIPDAAKITLIGTQDEKIYLEFDTRQLAGLGIDSNEVVASLRAQNAVEPAGIIRGARESILLRVTGQFLSEESLQNLDLYANGRFYRLRDVATVRRGYADPPQPMFRFNGEPAIGLAVATAKGADILRFGDALRRRMEEIKADLPIGIEPHLVADQSIVARAAVSRFTQALWEAIAIVLAVSFLTLGLRAGAVVALSIPLVLAIVFLGMALSGISLQRVSLGALVIALGLLVDDAMVTIEMMVSRLERGFDRLAAATHAYSTTAFPMLTGTLVTIAGFVPIGFARSNAGEYCFSLFAVIAIALVVSWLVAVLFTPLLGVMILREPPRQQLGPRPPGHGEQAFRTALLLCMRARYATIAVTLALFALAVVGLRFVQQQFFPASDRPELVIDLSLPQNATITATEAAAETLEKLLAGDPNIDQYSVYVGQGAVRFYLPLNVQLAHDYFAQAVVVTTGLAAREAVRSRLEEALATALPDIATRIYPLELGPPVGWPLQYRVSGADPQKIRDLAYAVADIVGSNPWTRKIGFDWNEPIKAVHVNVDQDKARRLGISSEALAQAIDATTRGLVITQLRDYVYLVDVIARSRGNERASLDTLRELQLPFPGGRNLPLLDVASLEYTLDQPLIWRRDRLPTITVQADLSPGHRGQDRDGAVGGEDRRIRADIAGRLPHRNGRHGGCERQGAGLGHGRGSDHDRADGDDPHGATAEFSASLPRRQRRAARPDRRRGGAAAEPYAARVHRDARRHRLDRDDHSKFGHPDRSDRPEHRYGRDPLERSRQRGVAPNAPDPLDRGRSDAWHAADSGRSVLGTDGLCDYRRSRQRYIADVAVPAGALCCLVPHPGNAGSRGHGRSERGRQVSPPSGSGCGQLGKPIFFS